MLVHLSFSLLTRLLIVDTIAKIIIIYAFVKLDYFESKLLVTHTSYLQILTPTRT